MTWSWFWDQVALFFALWIVWQGIVDLLRYEARQYLRRLMQ